jgi:hypothetical protein
MTEQEYDLMVNRCDKCLSSIDDWIKKPYGVAEFLECNDGEYYYYEPLNEAADDLMGETFGNDETWAVNDQGLRSCIRLANEKKVKVVIQ